MTMDYMSQFSDKQAILLAASEVCSKHAVEFPSDVERDEFLKKCVVKFLVTTTFTGLADGLYFQLRIASNVNLSSDAVVIAQTGIILPAYLVKGDMYELAVPARRWVAGYDFFGVWYEKVSAVATAGNVSAWLDDAE